ncbi:MAG: hypothetical protein ACLFNY_07190 [Candidatus Aenigmatarchaeota archaeon]
MKVKIFCVVMVLLSASTVFSGCVVEESQAGVEIQDISIWIKEGTEETGGMPNYHVTVGFETDTEFSLTLDGPRVPEDHTSEIEDSSATEVDMAIPQAEGGEYTAVAEKDGDVLSEYSKVFESADIELLDHNVEYDVNSDVDVFVDEIKIKNTGDLPLRFDGAEVNFTAPDDHEAMGADMSYEFIEVGETGWFSVSRTFKGVEKETDYEVEIELNVVLPNHSVSFSGTTPSE